MAPVRCQFCGKIFTDDQYLTRHRRTCRPAREAIRTAQGNIPERQAECVAQATSSSPVTFPPHKKARIVSPFTSGNAVIAVGTAQSASVQYAKQCSSEFGVHSTVLDVLRSKGGIFALVGDLWYPFVDILYAGMTRSITTDAAHFTARENRQYTLFCNLKTLRPAILTDIANAGEDGAKVVANRLERGRKNVRNSAIHDVKEEIRKWTQNWAPDTIPVLKSLRGFYHERCGELLCPPDYDWSDTVVKNSLRTRDGPYINRPTHFCRLLWPEGKYNPDEPTEGFLRNDLIVRACKLILLGALSAVAGDGAARNRTRGQRKSRAATHKITTVNTNAIAGAAVTVHFALSSQTIMAHGPVSTKRSQIDNAIRMGQWPYEVFYRTIIDFVEKKFTKAQREDLHHWYTIQVFGDEFAGWNDHLDDSDLDKEDSTISPLFRRMLQDQEAALAAEASAERELGTGDEGGEWDGLAGDAS